MFFRSQTGPNEQLETSNITLQCRKAPVQRPMESTQAYNLVVHTACMDYNELVE